MAYFRPPAEDALSFIDQTLAGRQWLVGETCSIADIGCWGRMVFMAEGGFDIATLAESAGVVGAAQGDARLCPAL